MLGFVCLFVFLVGVGGNPVNLYIIWPKHAFKSSCQKERLHDWPIPGWTICWWVPCATNDAEGALYCWCKSLCSSWHFCPLMASAHADCICPQMVCFIHVPATVPWMFDDQCLHTYPESHEYLLKYFFSNQELCVNYMYLSTTSSRQVQHQPGFPCPSCYVLHNLPPNYEIEVEYTVEARQNLYERSTCERDSRPHLLNFSLWDRS